MPYVCLKCLAFIFIFFGKLFIFTFNRQTVITRPARGRSPFTARTAAVTRFAFRSFGTAVTDCSAHRSTCRRTAFIAAHHITRHRTDGCAFQRC